MRIIDPHVHFWNLRDTPRETSTFVRLLGWNRPLLEWVAARAFPDDASAFFGGPSQVLADYLPQNYEADASGAELTGFVHVEAGWRGRGPLGPVGETRWLEQIAPSRLAAIVAAADLSLGDDVAAVLKAHLSASGRVRGVRHTLAHHPSKQVWNACEDPNAMRDPVWRRGYARLADFGLHFEATVYHHQLPELFSLAVSNPDVPMVICHAGTPVAFGGAFGGLDESADARARIAEEWRTSMDRLAELPHVSVKLSGLAMPILGFGYERERGGASASDLASDFAPLVESLLASFGPERCMFASNFPVDRVSAPWSTLFDAFALSVAGRTVEERRALFAGTAARIYQIEAP